MIPMSCSQCGQRGKRPPHRLGTRMSCRKCHAVFHMDRTGHIMLGEPEGENGRKSKARKPKQPEGQVRVDRPGDCRVDQNHTHARQDRPW